MDEAAGIFTLRLCFTNPDVHRTYQFHPGQFNMVYLYGVGEVAISIVSDPDGSGPLLAPAPPGTATGLITIETGNGVLTLTVPNKMFTLANCLSA